MICYLVQIMYLSSRSSTEILIWQKTWLPRTIFDSDSWKLKKKISLETYIQVIDQLVQMIYLYDPLSRLLL